MAELLLLAVLVTLIVLAIRRPVAVVEPQVIRRVGLHHITLDPKLGHARTFLELIAEKFPVDGAGDTPGQYFEVCDSAAPTKPHYLLAVAQRKGVLYIQAILPLPLLCDADSHLNTIRQFSDAVLALQPIKEPADEGGRLRAAVLAAAVGSGKVCTVLQS